MILQENKRETFVDSREEAEGREGTIKYNAQKGCEEDPRINITQKKTL